MKPRSSSLERNLLQHAPVQGEPAKVLHQLSQATYHRSISTAADEPMCLATLLSLDVRYVVEPDHAEDRMVRIWELASKKFRGMSAGLIFSEHSCIDRKGWRWAPRSLLNSGVGDEVSFPGKSARFLPEFNNKMVPQGRPTPQGFRVQLSGGTLSVRSLPRGAPLHPWAGLMTPRCKNLFYVQRPPVYGLGSTIWS